jgi:methyl-accepting chemotaxis protein
MTLRTKLLSAILFLTVAIVTISGAAFYSSSQSGAALSGLLEHRVKPLQSLKEVADLYNEGILNAGHRVRNDNISIAEGAALVRESRQTIAQHWKDYRATNPAGEEAALAAEAERLMTKAAKDVENLQGIMERGDRAGLDGYETETYEAIAPISEAIDKLVEMQIQIASSDTDEAIQSANFMFILMLVLAAAGLAAAAVAFMVVTRGVVRPIKGLGATIQGLARENSDASVPHTEQKDEIGDIARAVDAFRGSVVEKERQRAAAAAAVQERVTTALADGLTA